MRIHFRICVFLFFLVHVLFLFFFFQAEDGIRVIGVTGVQTCALPISYRHGGGVLLPVLGKPYGDALTAGEIALKYDADEGSFSAWYFDHRFPINPQRYSDIIKTIVAAAHAADDPAGRALIALADENARPGLPSYAQAPALKQRLAR